MKSFSITDIERLSGVKTHTLRTWELRYGIPKPTRINKGARHYSLKETRQILLVALLNRYGFKISQLVAFSEEEIMRRLNHFNDDDCRYQLAIYSLLFSMYSLDITNYEKEIDHCFSKWTSHEVICNIIDPFLKYALLLWQGKRLAEEHLVVTMLRKKLLHCIEKLSISSQSKKTVLLFLSDYRQLDLSLLYACYLLRHAGIDVIYMGNDVSVENLSVMFDTVQPNFLYTYLPAKNNFPFQKFASVMNEKLPKGKLVVTLQTDKEIKDILPSNIIMTGFDKAMNLIAAL